jgi:hypothetical protein
MHSVKFKLLLLLLNLRIRRGSFLDASRRSNIHGGDSLTTSVLGVGDGVPDDVLEEDLEHTTGLLVDETGDTFDTATTSETTDGCCHGGPSCDAWRLPFRVLFLLYRGLTWLISFGWCW